MRNKGPFICAFKPGVTWKACIIIYLFVVGYNFDVLDEVTNVCTLFQRRASPKVESSQNEIQFRCVFPLFAAESKFDCGESAGGGLN